MADLYILPQTTYRAPSPQGRGRARELNTIIEDDQEDDVSPIRSPFLRKTIAKTRDRTQDRDKIQAWLAPLEPVFSDDVLTPKGFPTPRGRHFMTAPTLPSSPSTASFSGEEVSSQGSSYKGESWHRSSVMTDVTEFDDLYGVSDQESEPEINKRSSRKSRHSTTHFDQARKSLPQLHIPNGSHLDSVVWSSEPASLKKKNITSPVPPTPPSAVAMSPAMLSFMKAQHAQTIPTISAPPSLDGSLDGSLTSEQLAALTAPTTPIMAGEDPQDSGDWAGVQLQPGAMETLQALSGVESGGEEDMQQRHRHDQIIEVSAPPMAEAHPIRPRLLTSNISRTSFILSPAQQRSSQDLTKLEIPSPGGFFSGLSPRSRSTWHYGTSPAEDIIPPTSTTAEQFYRVPWSREDAPAVPSLPQGHHRPSIITSGDYSDEPVEQVIEMLDTIKEEEVLTAMRVKSPVTAIRVPQANTTSAGIAEQIMSPLSPRDDVAVTEIVVDYDPEYARKQQEIANSHIDRTEVWLRAQFAYLRGVGFEPSEAEADVDPEKAMVKTAEESSASGEETERAPTPPPKDGEQAKPTSGLTRKKTVRFTNQVTAGSPVEPKMPCDLPSKLLKQESTYYRAFQSMTVKATQSDTFVSRSPRFEALQAQRISLREQHRAQLLGKYQLSVVPQSAKKRMSANVARGDDIVFEDPEKMRAEKEAEALKQMATANWHVAATKMLNGGRLVCAPVHKRLARLSLAPGAAAGPKRLRILDLGGQSTCDWAWHAAHQYPNSKVYTVTTKAIRQLSNANVRGPPNHRQVAVASLAKLPFDNDQFDLVSARELHSILTNSDVVDAEDEWDACLREIMRVLKPGGYVDFSVMDSDIVNAGPLGLAKSVEFGFTLKTLGYDPSPTKSFVSRLDHAGFEGVRRGWVMLPLGPKPVEKPGPVRYAPVNITQTSSPAPTASEPTSQQNQEQEQFGSTDNAAAVAGVAGTWSWERWILRCEMEKAAGELHSGFKLADTVSTDGGVMKEAGKSLDGVAAVISEGRACGAGLRLLKGFARKPERRSQDLDDLMGTIDMMLDF